MEVMWSFCPADKVRGDYIGGSSIGNVMCLELIHSSAFVLTLCLRVKLCFLQMAWSPAERHDNQHFSLKQTATSR